MPKDPLAGLGLDDTPVTHRPSPPLLIWWGRFTALDFFFFLRLLLLPPYPIFLLLYLSVFLLWLSRIQPNSSRR